MICFEGFFARVFHGCQVTGAPCRHLREKLSESRLDTKEKRLIFWIVKFMVCSLSDAFRRAMHPMHGGYPHLSFFLIRIIYYRNSGCGYFKYRRA
jgi:hypothetical protein